MVEVLERADNSGMVTKLIAVLFLVSSGVQAATVTVSSGTKSPSDFTATDDVVINGSVSFNSGTYNVNSLTVNATRTLTALGDVSIPQGVIINAVAGVTVNGTFTASGKGYIPGNVGPGGDGSNSGSHGGAGGRWSTPAGVVYGNALSPVTLGSAGDDGNGGGAIKIVASALTVSGTLSADGITSITGSGAGGSIWIIVDALAGSGAISAKGGGDSYAWSGGGGGRISIMANNAFSGTISVAAGPADSAQDFLPEAGTFLFRYKSSPNNIICNIPKGSNSKVGGTVFAADLPASLNDFTLSGGCNLKIFGDLVCGGNISVTGASLLGVLGDVMSGYGWTIAASNVTVDSSSAIHTNGLGYQDGGPGNEYFPGGTHGGIGGTTVYNDGVTTETYSATLPTYGNPNQPVQLGSAGGNSYAGGALKLIVTGSLQLDGSVSANGEKAPLFSFGSGSGGSVLLYAGSLSGAGVVSANGGDGTYTNMYGMTAWSGGGGGGRVAFMVAGTNTFTGSITANGGAGSGGSSTAGANGTVVNLTPAAATKLAVSTQPSTVARRNEGFATQPIFSVQDASSYQVPLYSGTISVSAYTDATCTTPAAGILGGTLLSAYGLGKGVDLAYDSIAAIYIKATSGSLTSACTARISVGSIATKLVVSQQPSTTATAGTNFSTQPKLEARDASNNMDYVFAEAITMEAYSDASCTNLVGSGTLSGSAAVNSGVYTYSGTKFTKAGPLYLKFSSAGVSSACANLVTVNAAAINKIAFTTQPSSTASPNIAFTQQPVVTGQDTYGNTVPSYTSSITLAAYSTSNCSGGTVSTLSATTNPLAAVAGVASYSGVKFSTTGTIYIKATQSARTACSTAVVLAPSGATKLVFVVQPSVQIAAQTPFAQQPVVAAQDDSNTTDTSYATAVTLYAYSDAACTILAPGTLNANSVVLASGVVNTTGLRYTQHGSFYIGATSGSLTKACSNLVKAIPTTFFRGY
ncbi:beta strand repeat-containing protein [Bdellovibrio sp. HCB290]|uniref:beta strand repeat-containing protein n=1 Tax=Bdellovibrio sp. HCB290 TaxID=3394356 RepID=UPI0039B3EF92